MGGSKSKSSDLDTEINEIMEKRGKDRFFYCFDYEGKKWWFRHVFDLLKYKKYDEFEKMLEAHPDVMNYLTYENHYEPTLLIHAVEYEFYYDDYCKEQNYPIVEYLTKHEKCDITMPDWIGNTAFHFAVVGGKLQFVKWLLERDQSVLHHVYLGRTPLHFAASTGNKEIVEFLLQQDGIDVNVNDHFGKTPYREKNIDRDIVKMIKDHRKKILNTRK